MRRGYICLLLVLWCQHLSWAPTTALAAKKPPCVASLEDCPLEGCGGDPGLNTVKNRQDPASDPEKWGLDEIIGLQEEIQEDWKSGMDRVPIEEAGEGFAVVVTGYLIHASNNSVESCNCRLPGPENKDIHVNLVTEKEYERDESVVAEFTPRNRPDGWTVAKLGALAKKRAYVRITGWLMLDTEHLSRPGGPRATIWEIHPVTKCEICTKSKSDCDKGKGWKALATYPD